MSQCTLVRALPWKTDLSSTSVPLSPRTSPNKRRKSSFPRASLVCRAPRNGVRRLCRQKKTDLELAETQLQREDTLRVLRKPDQGAHLDSPYPLFLGQGPERPVGALGAARSGLGFGRPLNGLVADLAPELGVGHAGVSRPIQRYIAVG